MGISKYLILASMIIIACLSVKIAFMRADIVELKSRLDIQNEAVKSNALEVDKYKKTLKSSLNRIKEVEAEKYNFPVESGTCKKELKSLKALLKTFFSN